MIDKLYIEKITPQQKQLFNRMGATLIDEVDIDGYTIALTGHGSNIARYFDGAKYQIGIQREGRDFTNPTHQTTKSEITVDKFPISKLKDVIVVIKTWINKYGKIAASSYNEEKTILYNKIFKKYGINSKIINVQGHYSIILEEDK